MREILAAWACCSLVGLGALLIAERDRTAIAVYAGVHIPARSESTAPGRGSGHVRHCLGEEPCRHLRRLSDERLCRAG